MLLHVDDTEHDIHAWQDIEIKTAGDSKWAHDRSMRSFCEVLYYCDAHVTPTMQISIKGTAVEPRNWDTFLCAPSSVGDGERVARFTPRGRGGAASADPGPSAGSGRAAASKAKSRIATEAAGGQPSGGGRQYEHGWTDLERGAPDKYEMATVQFGYQAPLPDVVRTLKSKDNEEWAKAERRNLLEYHGVFYYHTGEMEHPITRQRVKQGRMIVPLTKVGVQDPKKQNAAMPTVQLKLSSFGHALVGVVCENVLTPVHNKREYVATVAPRRAAHPREARGKGGRAHEVVPQAQGEPRRHRAPRQGQGARGGPGAPRQPGAG